MEDSWDVPYVLEEPSFPDEPTELCSIACPCACGGEYALVSEIDGEDALREAVDRLKTQPYACCLLFRPSDRPLPEDFYPVREIDILAWMRCCGCSRCDRYVGLFRQGCRYPCGEEPCCRMVRRGQTGTMPSSAVPDGDGSFYGILKEEIIQSREFREKYVLPMCRQVEEVHQDVRARRKKNARAQTKRRQTAEKHREDGIRSKTELNETLREELQGKSPEQQRRFLRQEAGRMDAYAGDDAFAKRVEESYELSQLKNHFREVAKNLKMFWILSVWALERHPKYPQRLIPERLMIEKYKGISSSAIADMKKLAREDNEAEFLKLKAQHGRGKPKQDRLVSAKLRAGDKALTKEAVYENPVFDAVADREDTIETEIF